MAAGDAPPHLRADGVRTRALRSGEEAAARGLILAGLRERWGNSDPDMNPDLEDIAAAYAGATFLVAEDGSGDLIGTGALVNEADGVARIVRVAVAADARRRGVGRMVLNALLERARAEGYGRIVLETTETWGDAIAFYERCGFREVGRHDGEAHMVLDLRAPRVPG